MNGAEIIKLDKQLKRYTYNPPVARLTEAGVTNLNTVNNPEIELKKKGWVLKKNVESNNVDIMINSVLDPPKLKAVNSSIVKNLLDKDLIQAIHDDFGVHIDNNYYVPSRNKAYQLPIALLGRLAKGTVIGLVLIPFLNILENAP
ncbi:MAG: putative NAD(P)/FAD-binding protein YdhS [Oceanospirillaceae bacterium]|jgi:uncharacterized NAD(P)/FAD-binding protein YdhS